jgi:hypothetical protein
MLRTRVVDAAAIAVANLYLKPCYQVFKKLVFGTFKIPTKLILFIYLLF